MIKGEAATVFKKMATDVRETCGLRKSTFCLPCRHVEPLHLILPKNTNSATKKTRKTVV